MTKLLPALFLLLATGCATTAPQREPAASSSNPLIGTYAGPECNVVIDGKGKVGLSVTPPGAIFTDYNLHSVDVAQVSALAQAGNREVNHRFLGYSPDDVDSTPTIYTTEFTFDPRSHSLTDIRVQLLFTGGDHSNWRCRDLRKISEHVDSRFFVAEHHPWKIVYVELSAQRLGPPHW